MLLRKISLILFIFTFPLSSYAATISGFDEICSIYTETQNSGMDRTQISDYIQNNINARVQPGDALDVHDAIYQLDPAERYSVFKQTAEISTKGSWDCEAIRNMME